MLQDRKHIHFFVLDNIFMYDKYIEKLSLFSHALYYYSIHVSYVSKEKEIFYRGKGPNYYNFKTNWPF